VLLSQVQLSEFRARLRSFCEAKLNNNRLQRNRRTNSEAENPAFCRFLLSVDDYRMTLSGTSRWPSVAAERKVLPRAGAFTISTNCRRQSRKGGRQSQSSVYFVPPNQRQNQTAAMKNRLSHTPARTIPPLFVLPQSATLIQVCPPCFPPL
jgi:hypothetical protein